MMFISSALSADGLVTAISTVVGATTKYNAGQAYNAAGLPIATTAAVAASDARQGGFQRSSTGILRLFDATAALPAGAVVNSGVAFKPTGELCYIQGASAGAGSVINAGVACHADGRVYMNLT